MEVMQNGILPIAAQCNLNSSRTLAAGQTVWLRCQTLRDSVSKSSAHFAGSPCMYDCGTQVHRDMDFSAEKAILKLLGIRLCYDQKEIR